MNSKHDIADYSEKRTYGIMSWKVLISYFRVGGGLLGTLFLFFVFTFAHFLIVYGDYWISNW